MHHGYGSLHFFRAKVSGIKQDAVDFKGDLFLLPPAVSGGPGKEDMTRWAAGAPHVTARRGGHGSSHRVWSRHMGFFRPGLSVAHMWERCSTPSWSWHFSEHLLSLGTTTLYFGGIFLISLLLGHLMTRSMWFSSSTWKSNKISTKMLFSVLMWTGQYNSCWLWKWPTKILFHFSKLIIFWPPQKTFKIIIPLINSIFRQSALYQQEQKYYKKSFRLFTLYTLFPK